eukprot:c28058_g1_i1 orf=366-1493(+)
MTRRCSYCGQNGHNSRTCQERGVKLFGVRLTHGSIRKCVSMGNLVCYSSMNMNTPASPLDHSESVPAADGYVSDGMVQTTDNSPERKKGIPWTEEEHRTFLFGLQKLGKGDWRGISRHFVTTRTPTQVASHAQKYFIRQSTLNKKKRRSSLFDITSDGTFDSFPPDESCWSSREAPGTVSQSSLSQNPEFGKATSFDPLGVPLSTYATPRPLSLPRLSVTIGGTQELTEENDGNKETSFSDTNLPQGEVSTYATSISTNFACLDGSGPPLIQNLLCPVIPFSFPLCPAFRPPALSQPPANSKIVKPTAILRATPVKIDVSNGISQLRLGISPPTVEPSSLSLKLSQQNSRNSAFHVNPSFRSNAFNSGSNAISVV